MSRRRYRRYKRSRGKWSPNIKTIGPNSFNITPETTDSTIVTLVTAPSYSENNVPFPYTVKNIEMSIEFENTRDAVIENCMAFVMYVPEGYVVSTGLPQLHPEWILAYKYFGSPNHETSTATTSDFQTQQTITRIRSRLARRLQTGDRIVLYVQGQNINASITANLQYQGLIRWWSKAN